MRRRSLSPATAGPRPSLADEAHRRNNLTHCPLRRQPGESFLRRFWNKNEGAIFVAVAQMFAALMNLSARLLEFEGDGMHPVEVLLLRQLFTSVCSFLYMWWRKVPDQPWGSKDVRWLLALRGFAGFFGIFGMWYSMMYLPLADATVITFLVPGLTGILCYFVMREPFTRLEQLATVVALFGVVLIARPSSLFSAVGSADASATTSSDAANEDDGPGFDHVATPMERLVAVSVAMAGIVGGSVAFTVLRYLGRRIHPLISVNVFGVACVGICTLILILAPILDIDQPMLRWVSPTSGKQWLLLMSLGVEGFIAQYLTTAGLALDTSNRANSMVYTHMLFAASFDRWVFGHHMGLMSFAGCALILASALGVVLMRKKPMPKATIDVEGQEEERHVNLVGESEAATMLVGAGIQGEAVQLERLNS